MTWQKKTSRKRIQKHLAEMGEIDIQKLKREAKLEELLSETVCREIYGAHVYIQIPNFACLASADVDEAAYKQLIQGIHIYQRALTRIVAGLGGTFIHFQGSKLHALFYHPIGNTQRIATLAVLFQLIVKDFVQTVFNPAFSYDFAISGGADLGNAIGTMDGIRGDRELLFIGSPANHAAKIISSTPSLRVTQNVYDGLPDELRKLCSKAEGGSYALTPVDSGRLDTLVSNYQLNWKRDVSKKLLEQDKAQFSLDKISYSAAQAEIYLDLLSITNNKRVLAATIFADVSGFTKYVDKATTVKQQRRALRVFHAIRKETARVLTGDYNGLRIQYQGDRIQGLFYLPIDDQAAIVQKVIEAAVGLQSSMKYTLKVCLPEVKDLKLAIGISLGTTLVSQLGARGQRDRICLGEAVEEAAQFEERCDGDQIALSKNVFQLLPEYLCGRFSYNRTVQGYVATDPTADQVYRAGEAKRIYGSGGTFIETGATGITIRAQESSDARKVSPSRPYAGE